MFFSFEKLKYSSKRCQKIGLKGNPSYEYLEPPKKNIQYFDYREKIQFNSLDEFRTQDTVWTLLKTLCIQSRMEVPTLPKINGSPTDWDNLYIAIRMANDLCKK